MSRAAAAVSRADAALDTLWAVASGAAPAQDGVPDALRALAGAVARSQKAAALARQRGAVTLLRRWLADADDSVLELAAAAVASLATQDTRSTRQYTFGAHTLRLRDASAVTGGLGWRVWRAALILCDLLRETPALVARRTVLELGAGCGACGMHAAALGARATVLSDCLPGLLEALQENVALNAAPPAPDAPAWAPRVSAQGGGTLACRLLDWEDASDDAAAEGSSSADAPPRLARGARFEVLLGSDVMYEHAHARALPGVLARHLAPGGFALLVCGVRFPDVLAAFLARLEEAGLQCSSAQLAERRPQGGCDDDSDDDEEDGSVTMTRPPLGQLGMLVWRRGETLPAAADPPPWTHSWS